MAWTKSEIEAYAEDNSIVLSGATTKAQMLAVIHTVEETKPVEGWGLDVLNAYAALNSIDIDGESDLEGVLGKCVAWWESEYDG